MIVAPADGKTAQSPEHFVCTVVSWDDQTGDSGGTRRQGCVSPRSWRQHWYSATEDNI